MSIKLISDQCVFKEEGLLITFNVFGVNNVVQVDYNVENFKLGISSSLPKMGDEFDFIINNFKKILDSNKNQTYIEYDGDIKRIKFVDHLGIDKHFRLLYKKTVIEFNIFINQEGIIIIDLQPSRYYDIINDLSCKIKEMDGLVSDEDYIEQLSNLLMVMDKNIVKG